MPPRTLENNELSTSNGETPESGVTGTSVAKPPGESTTAVPAQPAEPIKSEPAPTSETPEIGSAEQSVSKDETSKGGADNTEPPPTGKRSAKPFYSPDEWRLMAWIAGIGVVGGGIAKVLALPTVDNVTVIAAMLYGGIAALITVFFLARTDTDKRIHLTIFALLCGFVGSPLVQKAVSNFGEGFGVADPVKQSQDASRISTSILADSGNLNQSTDAAQKVTEAGTKINAALQAPAETQKPEAQSQVESNAEKTVDALQAVAPKAPEETAKALQKIGITAARTGRRDLAERALNVVRDLSTGKETGSAASAAVEVLNRVLDIKPRIYLEVSRQWSGTDFEKLKAVVDQIGYPIAKIDRGQDLTAKRVRVRYYDEADAKEANYIVEKMKPLLDPQVEVSAELQSRKPADFRPRHFDVEVGSGVLPP